MMGVFIYGQQAEERLPAGEVNALMGFADAAKPATGGEVTRCINDRPVGKGRMDHTVPIRLPGHGHRPRQRSELPAAAGVFIRTTLGIGCYGANAGNC